MPDGYIGRTSELTFLEKEYQKNSSFVIVTGREGIGKTTLLKKFSEDRNALYFNAAPVSEKILLEDFSSAVGRFYGKRKTNFSSWTEAFEAFSGEFDNKKILIIDECQNIVGSKNFQKELIEAWINTMSSGSVMLIISTSNPLVLDSVSKDRSHPFYGRTTGSLRLGPLSFDDCIHDSDYAEAVKLYSLHGGVPSIYNIIKENKARDAFVSAVTDPQKRLVRESLYRMTSEFTDPAVYLSIARAIASGENRISKISSYVGVSPTTLNSYLKKMQEMYILTRSVPVTEYFPEKSKSGVYSLSDSNMRFWCGFVLPHLSEILADDVSDAVSDFDARFVEECVSKTFSEICLSMMPSLFGKLGFLPLMTGKYWNKDVAMDIIALNPGKRRAFVGGCFYRDKGPVGRTELNQLLKDAEKVPELKGCVVKIGLFSVTGFESGLFGEKNILLVDKGIVLEH